MRAPFRQVKLCLFRLAQSAAACKSLAARASRFVCIVEWLYVCGRGLEVVFVVNIVAAVRLVHVAVNQFSSLSS